jgi:hypothetical protein
MRADLQAVHPVFRARDVVESVQFYESIGFSLAFQDSPTNPKYAGVRRDGVELHIQWADEEQRAHPTDRPIFRFVVGDVDALYGEFVKSGAVHPLSSQGSTWPPLQILRGAQGSSIFVIPVRTAFSSTARHDCQYPAAA